MSTQKKYPVDIRSFPRIREEGYVYVDKTLYVYDLVTNGATYNFLSRPRRFGKSLLLSTVQAYFQGRKELFEGLAVEKLEKDWKVYPVVTLSLAAYKGKDVYSLKEYLRYQLQRIEKENDLESEFTDLGIRFTEIIESLHRKTGQRVVVLIDEYDTPMLNDLHNKEVREGIRSLMQTVYAPLKDLEDSLKFVLITGITKFSQLSIFSTLNNISNISMRDKYAAICGITADEIEREMADSVDALANTYDVTHAGAIDMLREYYDGYKFLWPSPGIFNPFTLINCFDWEKIKPFWFESGTPSYIIESLKKAKVQPSQLERMVATAQDFDAPIENEVRLVPLLYQSGYLTITGYNELSQSYILEIPNKEVRLGLMHSLIPNYVEQPAMARTTIVEMVELIAKDDINGALEKFKVFLKTVPYCRGTKSEGHWQQMLYVVFSLFGAYGDVECHTNDGRVDFIMAFHGKLYLWEVKLNASAQSAIDQIDRKEYSARFQLYNLPIVKIGISFTTKTHTIKEWKICSIF
ncbi:MAG: ATP-binding protein [Bacteroidales bacterium]|nr:ATP-binding protein [Bacteroidales bacterium]